MRFFCVFNHPASPPPAKEEEMKKKAICKQSPETNGFWNQKHLRGRVKMRASPAPIHQCSLTKWLSRTFSWWNMDFFLTIFAFVASNIPSRSLPIFFFCLESFSYFSRFLYYFSRKNNICSLFYIIFKVRIKNRVHFGHSYLLDS